MTTFLIKDDTNKVSVVNAPNLGWGLHHALLNLHEDVKTCLFLEMAEDGKAEIITNLQEKCIEILEMTTDVISGCLVPKEFEKVKDLLAEYGYEIQELNIAPKYVYYHEFEEKVTLVEFIERTLAEVNKSGGIATLKNLLADGLGSLIEDMGASTQAEYYSIHSMGGEQLTSCNYDELAKVVRNYATVQTEIVVQHHKVY